MRTLLRLLEKLHFCNSLLKWQNISQLRKCLMHGLRELFLLRYCHGMKLSPISQR